MSWILTHTGRKVHPFDLKPEDIDIEDIAHSLSNICRFNGHCEFPYSVAQHSLLVLELLTDCLDDGVLDDHTLIQLKLTALLHDATEAYLCDLPTPVKALLPEYKEKEALVWLAVCERFNLPILGGNASLIMNWVKEADRVALATEKELLMPFHSEPWECLKGIEPAEKIIRYMRPAEVKAKFLDAYDSLCVKGKFTWVEED